MKIQYSLSSKFKGVTQEHGPGVSDLQDLCSIATLGFTSESRFFSVPLPLDMWARTPRCSVITQLFGRKSELIGAEPRKTKTLGGRGKGEKSQGRAEINFNKWCNLRTRLLEADGEGVRDIYVFWPECV